MALFRRLHLSVLRMRGMKLSALGEGKEWHLVHYEKKLKHSCRIHVRLSRQLFCQIKKMKSLNSAIDRSTE